MIYLHGSLHVVVMFVRQAGALVMLTLLFTQRALPFWLRSAWPSLRLDRLCQSRWKSTDGATNEAHLTGIPHVVRQRGQAEATILRATSHPSKRTEIYLPAELPPAERLRNSSP